MKYQQHDFEKNINGAIRSGDPNKVMEILTNEVGKLMIKSKPALIAAVRKSGKQIPDTIKDEHLAKIIVSGILNKNERFLNNLISTIILENSKYSEAGQVGDIIQGVGNMVSGVSSAVAAGLNAKAATVSAKEGTKQQEIALRSANANMVGNIMQSKANLEASKLGLEAERLKAGAAGSTIVKGGLILGGLLLLGGVGFLIYKKMQAPQEGAVAA